MKGIWRWYFEMQAVVDRCPCPESLVAGAQSAEEADVALRWYAIGGDSVPGWRPPYIGGTPEEQKAASDWYSRRVRRYRDQCRFSDGLRDLPRASKRVLEIRAHYAFRAPDMEWEMRQKELRAVVAMERSVASMSCTAAAVDAAVQVWRDQ